MIQLEEITIIEAPIERCFDLSRSVEVHLARQHSLRRTSPRNRRHHLRPRRSPQQVTWRAKHFGIWQNLTSEYTAMEPPTYFQATMIQGHLPLHAGRSLLPNPTLRRHRDERRSSASPLPFPSSAHSPKPSSSAATCAPFSANATPSSNKSPNPRLAKISPAFTRPQTDRK